MSAEFRRVLHGYESVPLPSETAVSLYSCTHIEKTYLWITKPQIGLGQFHISKDDKDHKMHFSLVITGIRRVSSSDPERHEPQGVDVSLHVHLSLEKQHFRLKNLKK